jgi:hypothetical protein
MKKIVWIDIGVHFGQEYKSIFGSNTHFFWKLLRRFIGSNLRKGSFFGLRDLISLLDLRSQIRRQRKIFCVIFVEANPKIIANNSIYLKAESVFNVALTGDGNEDLSIVKLFLVNGDIMSQGNSIFASKRNVSTKHYISTIGLSSGIFMRELRKDLDESFTNYEVLLRLNCEGVEDDVIFSAHKVFNEKLKLVCGSLKDVGEVKGKQAQTKLIEFLTSQKIENVFFSPSVNSWPLAFKSILRLLN